MQVNNWSQVAGRSTARGGHDTDDVWYNALPRIIGVEPASYYSELALRKNFYDRKNLIQCPSAKFPPDVRRLNYQIALFSVAMNSHLILEGEGPSTKFQAFLNFRPVETVIFLDNLLKGEDKVTPAQEDSDLGQPAAYADRFSPRHSHGGNLAFADGHVAWFPGRQVVETTPGSLTLGGPVVPEKDIVWELPPVLTPPR